LPQTNTSRS